MKGSRVLWAMVFTFIFILILGYIDIEIITPLLQFSEDTCFYHMNQAPLWVDLFYLDGTGHIEPLFNGLHLLSLLLISLFFGILLSVKIIKAD